MFFFAFIIRMRQPDVVILLGSLLLVVGAAGAAAFYTKTWIKDRSTNITFKEGGQYTILMDNKMYECEFQDGAVLISTVFDFTTMQFRQPQDQNIWGMNEHNASVYEANSVNAKVGDILLVHDTNNPDVSSFIGQVAGFDKSHSKTFHEQLENGQTIVHTVYKPIVKPIYQLRYRQQSMIPSGTIKPFTDGDLFTFDEYKNYGNFKLPMAPIGGRRKRNQTRHRRR